MKLPTENGLKLLPLSSLVVSTYNVRKAELSEKDLKELSASIREVGVIQNLIVHPCENLDRYGVAVGRRRLEALNLLLSNNEIEPSYLVPVKIISEKEASKMSFIENEKRVGMSPYDRLMGFFTLEDEGLNASEIADFMGFTKLYVQRCLKYRVVSPKLIELLKFNKITFEQLKGLTLTTDHARQEDAWEKCRHWHDSAIAKFFTEGEIRWEKSGYGNFITLEEYKNAGGEVREDLFLEEEDVYIKNPILLEQLVNNKLEQIAKECMEKEGWSFYQHKIVEYYSSWSGLAGFKEIKANIREKTDQENERLNELTEKIQYVEGLFCDELDSETIDRFNESIDAMEAEKEEITDSFEFWTDTQKSKCGIYVYFNKSQKEVGIKRGLKNLNDPDNEGQQVSNSPKDKKQHSDKLVKNLTAHKTGAIQYELANNPHIALVFMTHHMVCSIFATAYYNYDLTINCENTISRLKDAAEDFETSKGYNGLMEQMQFWQSLFPEDFKSNHDWLMNWEDEQIIALQAFCFALSIDGTRSSEDANCYKGQYLEQIEKNLPDFNLLNYWQPTAENYYGQLKKDVLAKIISENVSPEDANMLQGKKKQEAALLAEEKMHNLTWLPDFIKA